MATNRDTKRKLTARQEAFVAEYLRDLNATQAAIRAGFSAKTAQEQSSRLLSNVMVAAAVAKAKAERMERVHFDQDKVLAELALLAFSDVSHYKTDETGNVTLAEGAPDGAVRALQSVKKKVRTYGGGEDDEPVTETETELRLWDKPGMLKLAGRHVGLFPDRVEISGPNGGPIQTQETPKTSADMRKELAALTGKKDVGTR